MLKLDGQDSKIYAVHSCTTVKNNFPNIPRNLSILKIGLANEENFKQASGANILIGFANTELFKEFIEALKKCKNTSNPVR